MQPIFTPRGNSRSKKQSREIFKLQAACGELRLISNTHSLTIAGPSSKGFPVSEFGRARDGIFTAALSEVVAVTNCV